ncbi:endothelial lipase isoform X2 [Microcaecilia unicolor]|uniref:triacylglycerol lipase n=1 Tax=Microcaecilia unicolor TaxID=1415580 RepID=A0A6P7XDV5_9AMPH|nr:endothelial lipase isoform X2 [Microcaecilia unicolor]
MRNLFVLLCFAFVCSLPGGDCSQLAEEGLLKDDTIADLLKDENEPVEASKHPVKFNTCFSLALPEEGCYLLAGQDKSIEDSNFNATAKTFFVIHGWTMSGMFESWTQKLVQALQEREQDANVVVVDWLFLAHRLYPDAVNNTKAVGKEIAKLLDWLQERLHLSLANIHLIGYSLGAHVAGYAGSFVNGTIGRITDIGDVVKCEHERSVHLFVDSLVNKDKESFAFRCMDSNRFKKGICLSCRKNRCNSIGYNVRKIRSTRSSKMYLKTRADMPFKVYHYQMKMHIFSYIKMEDTEPTFSVTLYGTNNDSQPLSLEILEQINFNFTNTFLVHTEKDLGDLLKIKLSWEGSSQTLYSLWKELKSFYWSKNDSNNELHVRRIRIKSGETQQKFTFCAEDDLQRTKITPGKDLYFLKCRDGWEVKNRKRLSL